MSRKSRRRDGPTGFLLVDKGAGLTSHDVVARLRKRFDDPERAPAGITVVGPNGAGKTFILEAFARETDRTVGPEDEDRRVQPGERRPAGTMP